MLQTDQVRGPSLLNKQMRAGNETQGAYSSRLPALHSHWERNQVWQRSAILALFHAEAQLQQKTCHRLGGSFVSCSTDSTMAEEKVYYSREHSGLPCR